LTSFLTFPNINSVSVQECTIFNSESISSRATIRIEESPEVLVSEAIVVLSNFVQ
jgi:hypothetical protein